VREFEMLERFLLAVVKLATRCESFILVRRLCYQH
jgi:hypothetical protein